MRKGKLQPNESRPFKPAGWMIVDRQSGLLRCFGRNRRVVDGRVYKEQGGVLHLNYVSKFWISYRLRRYLEQYAGSCSPSDWAVVRGFPEWMDLVPV